MDQALPIIIVLAVVGIVIWLVIMAGRKRTAAWESISQRLGGKFLPKGSAAHTSYPFQLFNRGTNRKTKNHLQWELPVHNPHLYGQE